MKKLLNNFTIQRLTKIITSSRTDTLFLWSFLLSIFFFKTPSFYVVPFIKSSFLMSQAIARIFILIAFIFIVLKTFFKNNQLIEKGRASTIAVVLIVFFAWQSLSIIPANNMEAFISRYKDVFISILSFFISYYYRKNITQIILAMIAASCVNILYQSVLLFFPNIFITLMGGFIYTKHFDLVVSNIYRGRIYADIYDELVIPFLFIPFLIPLKKSTWISVVLICLLSFFAFASNFRTRILMILFSLATSLLFIKKLSSRAITTALSGILILMFIANVVLSSQFGYSFYDRFFIPDEAMDNATAESRITQIKTGLEMGTYSIFGVGLGNYYDHLNAKEKPFSPNPQNPTEYRNYAASLHIHNNIAYTVAESGYIGGAIFIMLLLLFAYHDSSTLRSGTDIQKATVIAFWCLFLYGFLNPTVPASYQVLFWSMRGLLL